MLLLQSSFLPRTREGRVMRLPDELPVHKSIYEPFRYNDVTVHGRVPLVVWNALETAGDFEHQSRAEKARELLFCHLYGRYDYLMMREYEEGFFYREPVVKLVYKDIVFQKEEYDMPARFSLVRLLGKASKELDLAMPNCMRDDLEKVAERIGRTPARTLREILVRELFGSKFELRRR